LSFLFIFFCFIFCDNLNFFVVFIFGYVVYLEFERGEMRNKEGGVYLYARYSPFEI